MKYTTVTSMLGSEILEAGLRAIFARLSDRGIDYIPLSVDNSALDKIIELKPSLLFIDPAACATLSLKELRENLDPLTRIIAITAQRMVPSAERHFDAIISIYDSARRIIETIQETIDRNDGDDDSRDLSPREREVVIGIVKGLSNKEIAADINVSVNTVMTHRRNIARKLQIHSPAALTVYAIVKNLVKIEEIKTILPSGV